jgi:hypothetical protein
LSRSISGGAARTTPSRSRIGSSSAHAILIV